MRHQFWQASLAVTVLVLLFLALDPLPAEVVNNRCRGAPVVLLLDPMPERVNTLVPDPGTLCNNATRERAMVAAFVGVVGLGVTVGLALAATANKAKTTPAAAS